MSYMLDSDPRTDLDRQMSFITHQSGNRRTPERPRNRNLWGGIVLLTGGLLLASCSVVQTVRGDTDGSALDNGKLCEPSAEIQIYTVEDGDTVSHIVHGIEGSGDGPGDPCFDEALKIVEGAVGSHITTPGEILVLPESMEDTLQ